MATKPGLTRRDFLRASALSLAGLSLLSACAPTAPAAKPVEPAKPAEPPKPAEAAKPSAAPTMAPAAAATAAAFPKLLRQCSGYKNVRLPTVRRDHRP